MKFVIDEQTGFLNNTVKSIRPDRMNQSMAANSNIKYNEEKNVPQSHREKKLGTMNPTLTKELGQIIKSIRPKFTLMQLNENNNDSIFKTERLSSDVNLHKTSYSPNDVQINLNNLGMSVNEPNKLSVNDLKISGLKLAPAKKEYRNFSFDVRQGGFDNISKMEASIKNEIPDVIHETHRSQRLLALNSYKNPLNYDNNENINHLKESDLNQIISKSIIYYSKESDDEENNMIFTDHKMSIPYNNKILNEKIRASVSSDEMLITTKKESQSLVPLYMEQRAINSAGPKNDLQMKRLNSSSEEDDDIKTSKYSTKDKIIFDETPNDKTCKSRSKSPVLHKSKFYAFTPIIRDKSNIRTYSPYSSASISRELAKTVSPHKNKKQFSLTTKKHQSNNYNTTISTNSIHNEKKQWVEFLKVTFENHYNKTFITLNEISQNGGTMPLPTMKPVNNNLSNGIFDSSTNMTSGIKSNDTSFVNPFDFNNLEMKKNIKMLSNLNMLCQVFDTINTYK